MGGSFAGKEHEAARMKATRSAFTGAYPAKLPPIGLLDNMRAKMASYF